MDSCTLRALHKVSLLGAGVKGLKSSLCSACQGMFLGRVAPEHTPYSSFRVKGPCRPAAILFIGKHVQ